MRGGHVGSKTDIHIEQGTAIGRRSLLDMHVAGDVVKNLTREQCAGITMYTSCEPCAMCTDAIGRARIPDVVFALSAAMLAEIRHEGVPLPSVTPRTEGPLLEAEAAAARGYYLDF